MLTKTHMEVAFFDTHLETVDGQIEFTPAYRVAKQFCRDLRPAIGIMGGDWLDLAYMSRFTKDSPLLVEGRRFKNDLDLTKRELAVWQECFGRFEFIPGNHDDRITRFVERFPLFEGLLSIRQNYGIDELGIGWTEYGEVLSIGKRNFAHGWWWNQYHAAKHLRKMGDHLFYGHVHDHQEYTERVRARLEPFTAMSCGCLCALDPRWRRGNPTNWINGILVVEVASSGNFSPLFIPIIDGELSYGGYTWRV